MSGLIGAGAAHARTFNVSSPSDPQWATKISGAPKVVRDAQPGDIIVLGSGSYGSLSPGYSVGKGEPGVTITAAKDAVVEFGAMTFTAGGWHIRSGDGRIKVTGTISVSNGDDFVFEGLDITGLNGRGSGINYRNVTHLSVLNCNIHHLDTAITGLNAKHVIFDRNTFSDSRSDLLHLGGDLSDANISHNLFTRVLSKTLLHQDALQIFSTFATEPLANIKITYNRFIRGNDGQPVQAIFTNNSTSTPFKNLIVSHNLIMMGNWWGIGVQAAQDFSICNNYVGGFTDSSIHGQTMRPWIKITDSVNGYVCNNVSVGGIVVLNSTKVSQKKNRSDRLTAPGDLGSAMTWWAANAAQREASGN